MKSPAVNIPMATKHGVQVDAAGSAFYVTSLIAGWSSLVARRAHNPKVAGSNPAPATTADAA